MPIARAPVRQPPSAGPVVPTGSVAPMGSVALGWARIASATAARIMPPFFAVNDGSCRTFEDHGRWLSDADITTRRLLEVEVKEGEEPRRMLSA